MGDSHPNHLSDPSMINSESQKFYWNLAQFAVKSNRYVVIQRFRGVGGRPTNETTRKSRTHREILFAVTSGIQRSSPLMSFRTLSSCSRSKKNKKNSTKRQSEERTSYLHQKNCTIFAHFTSPFQTSLVNLQILFLTTRYTLAFFFFQRF